MKPNSKILTVLKYILFVIIGLISSVAIGLLLYYHSIYTETPLPPKVKLPMLSQAKTPTGKPILLPVPKKLQWTSGFYTMPSIISFSAPTEDAQVAKKVITERLNRQAVLGAGALIISKNTGLPSQAYTLHVKPSIIQLEYGDFPGLFYALTTLKQLASQSLNKVPCVTIEDKPDLPVRGAMLDISRGKVPTLQTLFTMVDFLSDIKYNHLQLYVEGFSFGYPTFRQLWEKTHTPLTPDEIKELDIYCKDRFIDLVANQNSLGHMAEWLATDQFKDLAECPDGYKFLGLINMKTTLAPANPKSLELVEKMSEDLLPNFTSDKFNVDLDEPFELGKNKEHPIDDPKEVAKVYLDYAKRLNEFVKSKGKKMLMWADVVSRNPEVIGEIPKEITLLEWRYEAVQDFESICKKYKQGGLHYIVCPGTSTWTSFAGRTENMLANVSNAVENGIKYGADGMVITDWGDTLHFQYLTTSYSGFAWGGALSWNNEAKSQIDLGGYVSYVLGDQTHRLGNLLLDLGRYTQFEEYAMVGGSMTGLAYRFGMMDKTITDAIFRKFQSGIFELLPNEDGSKEKLIHQFNNPALYNSKAIVEFVSNIEAELKKVKLLNKDSLLILEEYTTTIRMILLGAKLKQYNTYHLQQTDNENKQLLTEMKALCTLITPTHERLWMSRNKKSGLEQTKEIIVAIQSSVEKQLENLEKNALARWVNKTIEKMKTAAAVLYLR